MPTLPTHPRRPTASTLLIALSVLLLGSTLSGCYALEAAAITPSPGAPVGPTTGAATIDAPAPATDVPQPTPTTQADATAAPPPTELPTALPTAAPTRIPTAAPTPEPVEVEFSLEPSRVVQGGTVLVRVATEVEAAIDCRLDGNAVNLVTRDGLSHVGLFGISAIEEPGALPLELRVTPPGGQPVTLRSTVQVIAGEFETEAIEFTPEVDSLLAPEVSQPEALRIGEVYATFSPEIRWSEPFSWPLEHIRTTSAFGTRRQYGDRPPTSYHSGLDLGGVEGTPVYAVAPGTVVLAETLQVRGNAVVIDHGAGVLSGYYHLSAIDVEPGQEVAAGDTVGVIGATGLVTGAHLHWEMRVGGVPVDPATWTDANLPAPWG